MANIIDVNIIATGPQGIPGIPGIQGLPGDSAYTSAVNGGYAGTEAEFYADLAAIDGLAAELEAIVG